MPIARKRQPIVGGVSVGGAPIAATPYTMAVVAVGMDAPPHEGGFAFVRPPSLIYESIPSVPAVVAEGMNAPPHEGGFAFIRSPSLNYESIPSVPPIVAEGMNEPPHPGGFAFYPPAHSRPWDEPPAGPEESKPGYIYVIKQGRPFYLAGRPVFSTPGSWFDNRGPRITTAYGEGVPLEHVDAGVVHQGFRSLPESVAPTASIRKDVLAVEPWYPLDEGASLISVGRADTAAPSTIPPLPRAHFILSRNSFEDMGADWGHRHVVTYRSYFQANKQITPMRQWTGGFCDWEMLNA